MYVYVMLTDNILSTVYRMMGKHVLSFDHPK